MERTLNNLKEAIARSEKSIIELSAIATFLHSIYNGIENILKQLLRSKNVKIPKSEIWHKDLLNLSVSLRIISEELSAYIFICVYLCPSVVKELMKIK